LGSRSRYHRPADEKKPDNKAAALRRRIRALEREVAQLRSRVVELSAG
jgi:uncharacterized protein YceH (UPF0502 family)